MSNINMFLIDSQREECLYYPQHPNKKMVLIKKKGCIRPTLQSLAVY